MLVLFLLYSAKKEFELQELGLVAGTPVGTSLIDAHAGGVGVMESVPVSDPEYKGKCSCTFFLFIF